MKCGIKKYRIIILQSIDVKLDEVIVSGHLRVTNRQNIRCWRCWDAIQTETTDRLQINTFPVVNHRGFFVYFVRPNAESILIGIRISHQTDVITLQGGNRFFALANIEGTFGIHQRRGALECSILDLTNPHTICRHGDASIKLVNILSSRSTLGIVFQINIIQNDSLTTEIFESKEYRICTSIHLHRDSECSPSQRGRLLRTSIRHRIMSSQ